MSCTTHAVKALCIAVTAALALAGCKTTAPASSTGGTGKPAPVASGPGGCKPLNPPPAEEGPSATQGALLGGALGALAGGAIGSQMSKRSSVGARNGALLGALAGALAGSQYAKQMQVTEQADGSVKLNIPGKILFGFDSSELSPEFRSTLDSVGGTVAQYCGLNARIVGHTDNVGKVDYNRQLSLRRASAVQSYLNSYLLSRGVNDRLLAVEGQGPDAPVAANTTEDGRAQNRRVEILIIPTQR